jgi:hypothetical protein
MPTLSELWDSAGSAGPPFPADLVAGLPGAARRYLAHAIAPATPLASAVRLRMHGEIKLGGWLPFTAEQVIHWPRGMIWKAAVRKGRLTIRGFDRLVDGQGVMRWKLFGMIPVMSAAGPDITRSGAGRVMAESVWLPSALCRPQVSWQDARARLVVAGEAAELTLTLDDKGALRSISLPRWGNPEGKEFRYLDFGGVVEEERCFGGYTIPSRIRAGYYFGSARFEAEGEFFRGTIDDAVYR